MAARQPPDGAIRMVIYMIERLRSGRNGLLYTKKQLLGKLLARTPAEREKRSQDGFDVPAAEPSQQVMTEATPPNYED